MADNALNQTRDPRGEMQASPRNRLMGYIADAMTSANAFATQMDPRYANKRQNQTAGILANAVSLGSLAKTADRMSYGEPLTNARQANVPWLKPETADALMMAPVSPRNALAAASMGLGMADNGAIGAAAALGGRMSKAEAEAAGYWHQIGNGKKLPMPVGEMTSTTVPVGNLAPRVALDPQSMLGSMLVPAAGDRSAAGSLLTEINGTRLPTPVMLEGGADFMRTHSGYGSAWASDKGVISSLAKKVREAGADGSDVYMPHVAMGHGSANFNTMMSDAALEQIKGGKITKKSRAAFDREVRTLRPEFLGVDHPDVRRQLEQSGALRHAFLDRMQLDDFVSAKFPDLASTRKAITEPLLMDAPLHSSGFAVAKMDPSGRVISDPAMPHSTYNTQLAGQYAGGFNGLVPRDVMFPDFYKSRRAAGLPVEGDARSFQLGNPLQRANQEWLDGVMRHLGQ